MPTKKIPFPPNYPLAGIRHIIPYLSQEVCVGIDPDFAGILTRCNTSIISVRLLQGFNTLQ